MDIPVNVEVQCVDGGCGRSKRVVVDQNAQQVTHLVVENQGFPRSERVVPIDMIRESTPQVIKLRCTQEEMTALPQFTELEYQQGDDAWQNYAPGQYLFAPGALPAQAAVPLERRNVPEGSLALQRGTRVEASDGAAGKIADVIVDPVSSEISHLVLETGSLFKHRRVTVTADQIDRIANDTVYLKLDKQALETLPDRTVE